MIFTPVITSLRGVWSLAKGIGKKSEIPVMTMTKWVNTSALKTYLKLLSLHQTDNMAVSSHYIYPGIDYTDTFTYMRELESRQIIVDCGLNSIVRFLNKALEMQMLTSEFHYHFTSLVSHWIKKAFKLLIYCI